MDLSKVEDKVKASSPSISHALAECDTDRDGYGASPSVLKLQDEGKEGARHGHPTTFGKP